MKCDPTRETKTADSGASEWRRTSLGSDVILLSGQHVMAADYNVVGNGIPYVTGPTDFDGYSVRCTKWTTNPKTVCDKGDILITVKGSGAGTLALAERAYCISRQLMAIRPVKLGSKFVFYCLQADQAELEDKATGLIPGISRKDLLEKLIPLPPLPEQRAIAEVLSDVDALIEQLDALIAKKRAVKTATMQRLLTGKQRLPGFSEPWETRRLGELANIQRGASPRPISDPKWYDRNSGVGWVRISDLTASNGIHLSETTDYLSEKGISASRFLPADSLIMSICATVGLPVITEIDACIHDGFVGFTNLCSVEQKYLYYKLKELEPEFRSAGQTGSQSNLNSSIVRNQKVLLPAQQEQHAIAQILSDMDAEIEALEARREKTQRLKQGMMQELLTGRTRLV